MKEDDLSEYLRAKEPGRAELAGMWRFGEGNTRTTSVFAIKYLHALGFEADNSEQLALSRAVRRLLEAMDGEMSRARIMKAIGIKDRGTFTDYYLSPAQNLGLVEMTQPDSPRSPTQKYRLTAKDRKAKEAV